jgi:hypothetical protein
MAHHRPVAVWWSSLLLLATTGCAGFVAPVAPGPATAPRVSWIVKSGEADSNSHEICRSDRPEPCVLEASSGSRPTDVTVSVFLYDAGVTTKYQGAFLSEFIKSAKVIGHETTVDYTCEPAKRPTGFAVTGPVVARPGDYKLNIALLATVPGRTDPHQFTESVPVRVVTPPGGSRAS